jgi:CysZ protein
LFFNKAVTGIPGLQISLSFFAIFMPTAPFTQLATALQGYRHMPSFASAHRLWGWLLMPGALATCIFLGIVWLLWAQAGLWAERLFVLLPPQPEDQWYWRALQGFIASLLKLFVLLLLFKLYKLIVLAFASPLLLLLSGKILQHLELSTPTVLSWWGWAKELWASLRDALTLLLKESLVSGLLLLAGLLFPLLAPVAALLMVLNESYFLGTTMLDLIGNHRAYGIETLRAFRKKYVWLRVGNGLVFNLLLLVPVAGFIVAPGMACAAMGLGVIALENKEKGAVP